MYKISDVAKMTNISTRTLRYYDEINLLKPSNISDNGYRLYLSKDLDKLQQILFYKNLGLSLIEINKIVNHENFNLERSLKETLEKYKVQRQYIDEVIANIELSLKDIKGEIKMSIDEKFKTIQEFEEFKDKMLSDNEKNYGEEMRANSSQYDPVMVKYSQRKVKNMTKEEFESNENLGKELQELLVKHVNDEEFNVEIAKQIYEMHKKWLVFYWGKYNVESHRGVCDMYIYDERFKKYYDGDAEGCVEFLRNCVYFVTNKEIE